MLAPGQGLGKIMEKFNRQREKSVHDTNTISVRQKNK